MFRALLLLNVFSPRGLSNHHLYLSQHFCTNHLINKCIGDLPLVEKVVATQLAKITCPGSRFFGQVDFPQRRRPVAEDPGAL